ncbi:MAG: hypothetical protein COA45_10555 [Zetaproteobacteria bacterium]|nr:MAG: hypothetical protein COA45_10555 [Zetaproteobacteria bacterium]
MKKHIFRAIVFIFFVGLFFSPIPRASKGVYKFIVQTQITYPLPDETIGLPIMVEDQEGKRGTLILRKNGEYQSKTLKIVKRDGKFYWDSWKGQRLNVVRGQYYITDVGLASTTFISADGDGMVFIFNPIIIPIMLCRRMATIRHHTYETKYMEVRSKPGEPSVIIRGKMRSMFYPDGFAEKLCAGEYMITPPLIYFKPSLFQQVKQHLFSFAPEK